MASKKSTVQIWEPPYPKAPDWTEPGLTTKQVAARKARFTSSLQAGTGHFDAEDRWVPVYGSGSSSKISLESWRALDSTEQMQQFNRLDATEWMPGKLTQQEKARIIAFKAAGRKEAGRKAALTKAGEKK